MTITGDLLKFQGARHEEWYSAKLILKADLSPKAADILIEDCSVRQYVNKSAKAIYELQGRTLTVAGNEPGEEASPTGFKPSRQTRVFVFKKSF